MIKELKKQIENIIKNNADKEITCETNNKDIGIYMIYINNFDDDKILPIYIGQTGCGKNRNFQNRYKEHLQEIMALNRLEYDYYKEALLKNFYDGHYKSCKIFQYMVDHNCTLKDFHMIVLEKVESEIENLQELLDYKEQEYFSKFLPAFFGFNQVNTVVEMNKKIYKIIKANGKIVENSNVQKYDLEDCSNFLKYFGYGYTKFNYYHCYPKIPVIKESDNDTFLKLKKQKQLLKSTHYDENKFKKQHDELSKITKQIDRNKKIIESCKSKFEKIYIPKIKKYCLDNKIGIYQKYNEIIKMVIYQNENNINDFKKYMKKKKINISILDEFNNDAKFVALKDEYLLNEGIYNKLKSKEIEYLNIARTDDLLRILPKRKYKVLPLKDKYKEIEFYNLENNSVIINLEFSNNGIGDWSFGINLIKMDYKLNINNKKIEKKNIFVKAQEYDENCKISYFEKDFGNLVIHREPFSVRAYPDYISTTMEVQNGINDFTIIDKEKIDFKSVFDEINLLINDNTKIVVKVRNKMKNKCKDFISLHYERDNLLKKKILLAL